MGAVWPRSRGWTFNYCVTLIRKEIVVVFLRDRHKYLAEAVGTFGLVFAGTGAIVVNDVYGSVSHVGIALTFGLVVMVMIYALGEVSGAHLNPAVTLGFWIDRQVAGAQVVPYIFAQVFGALAASMTLRLLFLEHPNLGATLPRGTWWQSMLLEFLLTSMLMFVILRVSSGSKETRMMAGVAVGGTVGLEALFAGPVCGASMNPARSLAPAIVSGTWDYLWIYLTATIAGAMFAVLVNHLMDRSERKLESLVKENV
ncbi:MAG: aquaporin [Planctomycetaceae bacterium]|nr:aquaporin [Planctomycetaceae bacterium]